MGLRVGAAISLALAACGSVGEPLPPLLNIPAKVEGFEARQEASEVVARWIIPDRTSEGANLRVPTKVVLYALDFAEDSQPPPLDIFEQLATQVAESEEEGETRFSVTDRYGKRTALAARAITAKGKASPWSDYAVLNFVRPPRVPELQEPQVESDRVRLTWPRSEGALGYVVERRIEGEDVFRAIHQGPAAAFEDRAFVWDREHVYRVRSQASSPTGSVPSEPSAERAITPTDVFPPPAPTGLRSVTTPTSIELTWDALAVDDLAGYRVLRGGEAAHEGLIATPSFSDADAGGDIRRYQVIAVDSKGNESKPSEPHQPR